LVAVAVVLAVLVKQVMQTPQVVLVVLELLHLLLEHLSLTLEAEAVVVNKVMAPVQNWVVLAGQVVVAQVVQVVKQALDFLMVQMEPQVLAVVVEVVRQTASSHHTSDIKAETVALVL
jgi:hypothetical protein